MRFVLSAVFFLFCNTNVVFANKWNHSLELSITRCFKTKNTSIQCNDFSEPKLNKLNVNEELEIIAIDYYGLKRSYGYGKAIEGNLCQNHLKKINRILQNTNQVCITGDDEVSIGNNETFSRWRGLETYKGKTNF